MTLPRRTPHLVIVLGLALAACGEAPRLVVSWDPTIVEADLPTVVAALKARAPQRALAELDRLQAAGTLPEGALHFRALALGDAGRIEDALDTWREELAARPGNGRAHALLARLLIERGELDDASGHLGEARRHAPDFPLVLMLDGRVAMLRSDDERAGRSFRDFLAMDPYGPYAAEAYHALAQIAARRGPEGTEDARRLQEASKKLGQVHGYLANFEDRLREDPDDVVAAYGVATAYLSLYENFGGDRRLLAMVEPALQYVLERAPGHAQALNNLGYVRLEQRRQPEALESFQAAVEADPEFAAARINLGTLLLKTGERESAVRELERALSVATTTEDQGRANLQLGRAREEEGTPESLRAAIGHYRSVQDLHPGDPMQLQGLIDELERRLGVDPESVPEEEGVPR
ncbi:MAG: tetratricopeptide repeat protein [Planctomycetota bacterium]|jgi:tetratricopeptide (TPR) repeat protein